MGKTNTRHTSVHAELFRWFLFSVCMGLLPLLLRWLLPSLFGSLLPLREVFKDGELFLVGIGLAGAALSDVLAARRGDSIGQIVMFVGMAFLILSSGAYGSLYAGPAPNLDHVITWSVTAFGACVVVGAAGILFKEAAK